MSLRRLVLRYGAVGGGSALVGWAASECLGVRNGVVFGLFGEAMTCALIGGAIAAGMALVAGRNGVNRWAMVKPAMAGLATGGLAGAIGMSLGHALLGTWYGGRALGWAIMGSGIGAAEGLYARSPVMLRQGVLAAAVGGLAGGIPFGVIYSLLARLSEPGSRAAAFIFLGSCVGAAIGLTSVVFARAWLTVVQRRPGRGTDPPLLADRPAREGRRRRLAVQWTGRHRDRAGARPDRPTTRRPLRPGRHAQPPWYADQPAADPRPCPSRGRRPDPDRSPFDPVRRPETAADGGRKTQGAARPPRARRGDEAQTRRREAVPAHGRGRREAAADGDVDLPQVQPACPGHATLLHDLRHLLLTRTPPLGPFAYRGP